MIVGLKKMITVLLTVCLLNVHISLDGDGRSLRELKNRSLAISWGVSLVYAEEATPTDVTAIPQTSPSSSTSSGNSKSFAPKGEDAVKSSQIMSILTMLGISIVVAGLLKSCVNWKADVIAAAVGAAAFIYSEVAAWKAYENLKFDKISGANVQKDTLKNMKKQYEEIKELAEKKQGSQKIAALAFLAAAGLAAYDAYKEKGFKAECSTALTQAGKEAATLAAAAATATTDTYERCNLAATGATGATGQVDGTIEITKNTPGLSGLVSTATKTELTSLDANLKFVGECRESPASQSAATTCKKYSEYTATRLNACDKPGFTVPSIFGGGTSFYQPNQSLELEPELKLAQQSCSFSEMLFSTDGRANLKAKLGPLLSSALDKASELLIPSAYAKVMSGWIGIGAAGMGYMATTYALSQNIIDNFVSTPIKRAVIWGVLAATAYSTANNTQEVVDAMAQNIQDIDKIIKNFDSISQSGAAGAGGGGAAGGTDTTSSGSGETTTSDIQQQIDDQILAAAGGAGGSSGVADGSNNGSESFNLANASSLSSGKSSAGAKNSNSADKGICVPGQGNSCADVSKAISSVGKSGGAISGDFTKTTAAIGALASASTPAALDNAGKQLSTQQNFLQNTNKRFLEKMLTTKDGKKLVKDVNGLFNRVQKSALAEMSGKGISEKAITSSVGGMNGAMATELAKATAKGGEGAGKSMVASLEPATLPAGDGGGSSFGNNESGNDLSEDALGTNMSEDGNAKSSAAMKNEGYDFSSGNIGSSGGPSLFDLLSIRYIRTAFPRLIDKVEPEKNEGKKLKNEDR